MAYSQDQWLEAKGLFLKGLSLSQIEADTGINKTSISKKAKSEEWDKQKIQQLTSEIVDFEKEKSTLDEKKSTLITKISTLDDFEVTILEGIVENQEGIKSLLFSSTAMALVRTNEALTKGKKTVMLKAKQYNDKGIPIGEEYTPYEVPLDSTDIKNHIEAVDKASLTLKINDRHAPKTEINNTNATQNNTEIKRVVIARRSDRIE